MGATGANHCVFFFTKSLFLGVDGVGRGRRRSEMGENACRRGQNQRSGTFYGASNLSGLPETYLACFKMFFVQ